MDHKMSKDMPMSYEDRLRKECPALFNLNEGFGDMMDDQDLASNKAASSAVRDDMATKQPAMAQAQGMRDTVRTMRQAQMNPQQAGFSATPSTAQPAKASMGLGGRMPGIQEKAKQNMVAHITKLLPSLDVTQLQKIYAHIQHGHPTN